MVWKGNFKGYSGEFDEDTVAEIEENEDVSVLKMTLFYISSQANLVHRFSLLNPSRLSTYTGQ